MNQNDMNYYYSTFLHIVLTLEFRQLKNECLIKLSADLSFLFVLSQSERLQDWCQPGAAGNGCDQHHGLLCVSVPCHRQLWEVCFFVCMRTCMSLCVFMCVYVCERERKKERERASSITHSLHLQDSSELPDWCVYSCWRDHHWWVNAHLNSLPPSCGCLWYHIFSQTSPLFLYKPVQRGRYCFVCVCVCLWDHDKIWSWRHLL